MLKVTVTPFPYSFAILFCIQSFSILRRWSPSCTPCWVSLGTVLWNVKEHGVSTVSKKCQVTIADCLKVLKKLLLLSSSSWVPFYKRTLPWVKGTCDWHQNSPGYILHVKVWLEVGSLIKSIRNLCPLLRQAYGQENISVVNVHEVYLICRFYLKGIIIFWDAKQCLGMHNILYQRKTGRTEVLIK